MTSFVDRGTKRVNLEKDDRIVYSGIQFNNKQNGLWKVSPNIQYLLELFVISSNNQIMHKLLFILFIMIE